MRTLTPVLCTSGLSAEARIARRAGFQVIVGAGDGGRTAALIAAAAKGARCLISFGIAGGLAPGLRPGDVILSTEVVTERRSWRADAHFGAQMAEFAASIGALAGPVFGASEILTLEADKRRTWRETGALAVDLESAIVAETAVALGIPFFVLRTIADPANRALPPVALVPLATSGKPALGRILAEMVCRPGQIGTMFALARETRRALAALVGPAHALRQAFAAPATPVAPGRLRAELAENPEPA